MMILTTKALKSRDQKLKLEGPTLVVGPNGAGKSTLADAVRFLALGYVPTLGKRPVDTAALMSGREMEVTLTLDDGRTIRRSIERQDRGYTLSQDASWLKNAKPTETAKAIQRLFGAEEVDAAEVLDIRELLAATPNQRAARLEALAAAGKNTPAEICEAVARLTVQRLTELSDERMPADYMTVIQLVAEKQLEILKANAHMLNAKIQEGGLPAAFAWANEQKRSAMENLRGKEQAAHELRIRAAEVPEPDARDIAALEKSRQDIDRDLGAARQAASGYGARAQRRRAAAEALVEARSNRDRWDAYMRDEHAGNCKRLQDLKEELARIDAEHRPLPPLDQDPNAVARSKEIAELNRKLAGLVVPEPITTTRERDDVDDLEAKLVQAQKSPWSEVLELAQELEDRLGTKGAKTAATKPIKRLRELARENAQDPLAIKHAIEHARELLRKAEAQQEKVEEERIRLTKEQANLRARIQALTVEGTKAATSLSARNSEILAAADRALVEWRGRRKAVQVQVDELQAQVTGANDAAARAGERVQAAENALAAVGPDEPPPADPKPLEAKLSEILAALARLQDAAATHREIQRTLNAVEEAKAGREVFSGIEWALQRQREVEISQAGGPLLTLMSEFLTAAGRMEKPFVRAGGGSCAIGWTKPDGAEISVQAMSGGEWCLYAAALTAAVLVLRDPPLKFLMVEAGEMDDVTLPQLLAGISAFSARLTGALVMSPRAPAGRPASWKVVICREEAIAA